MGTLCKLRQLVRRDSVSVREAARRLGIARNTAAKWLTTDEMVEPRYPKRASMPSILDPYKEPLTTWLKADSHRGKRERRGTKALFEALRAQGYGGSRGPVYEFCKPWRGAQDNAPRHVPASYPPVSSWAKPSSSTGAANTPSSAACVSGWKWPTPSWRPAVPSCWWPTTPKPTRCCLTPVPGRSRC